MYFSDTIVAIATAPGEGAVGILRISGPDALTLFHSLFRTSRHTTPTCPQPRYLHLGLLTNGNGSTIDQVLATYMPAPQSFTGEDVVEFHCHGGATVMSQALEACTRLCRLAEPGEFSRRAFLNGKIDLTQAQAIIDVIRSRTPEAARIANDVMQGKLRDTLLSLRDELISIQGNLEATIEFGEEEIAPDSSTTLIRRLRAVEQRMVSLIQASQAGMIMRQGASVAIVGKPNVGKSSLLNALSRSERSIVTAIPGTTRDIVEQYVDILGVPVRLLDTAGIRDSQDTVEQIGIERTCSAIDQADLVLWLLDHSRHLEPEDEQIAPLVQSKPLIILVNKCDLPSQLDQNFIDAIPSRATLRLSLVDNADLHPLYQAVYKQLCGTNFETLDSPLLSRARQRDSLTRACESIIHSLYSLEHNLGYELASMDIQHAFSYLGEIMGEVVTDDILEEIFSEFCIGK